MGCRVKKIYGKLMLGFVFMIKEKSFFLCVNSTRKWNMDHQDQGETNFSCVNYLPFMSSFWAISYL